MIFQLVTNRSFCRWYCRSFPVQRPAARRALSSDGAPKAQRPPAAPEKRGSRSLGKSQEFEVVRFCLNKRHHLGCDRGEREGKDRERERGGGRERERESCGWCIPSAPAVTCLAVPCGAGSPLPSLGPRILRAPLLEPAVSSPGKGCQAPGGTFILAERRERCSQACRRRTETFCLDFPPRYSNQQHPDKNAPSLDNGPASRFSPSSSSTGSQPGPA